MTEDNTPATICREVQHIMAWLTVREARKLTGYNAEHLRLLIRRGTIRAQKFGTLWQVDKKSLMAYYHAAREAAKEDGRYAPDSSKA